MIDNWEWRFPAQVIRVIDGDTVRLLIDQGFRNRREDNFRLQNVDTPERGQPGWREAKEFVEKLMPLGSICTVWSHRQEKYGRWLCSIIPVGREETLATSIKRAGLGK